MTQEQATQLATQMANDAQKNWERSLNALCEAAGLENVDPDTPEEKTMRLIEWISERANTNGDQERVVVE